ncbi:hypothetical protein [Azospirillum doebereinerae]|uniref:Uncharacterized protein n=1 Tax=Azospirillum doebereinerae TaxID=92933 RepID=A0A3S0WSF8_9PROT|nr:hypothetical protein [Azospirillum doebereinerae]RUQ66504.1 hypothetical protein EJ913_21955 [Azospirillum doebereinerae]
MPPTKPLLAMAMPLELVEIMLPSFQIEPIVTLPIVTATPELREMVPAELIDKLLPELIVWGVVTDEETVLVVASPGDGPRTAARTIIEAPARRPRRRLAWLRAETVNIIVLTSVIHLARDSEVAWGCIPIRPGAVFCASHRQLEIAAVELLQQ